MFRTMEKRRREAQVAAERFNAQHPAGTAVRYWTGVVEGEGRLGKTRSEAYVMGGHTAVVALEGLAGVISLSHVQPVEPVAA